MAWCPGSQVLNLRASGLRKAPCQRLLGIKPEATQVTGSHGPVEVDFPIRNCDFPMRNMDTGQRNNGFSHEFLNSMVIFYSYVFFLYQRLSPV